MKILQGNRVLIYQIADAAFKTSNISPSIIELGVLDGANAEVINQILSPKELVLIDGWSTDSFKDYETNNDHRSWVNDMTEYSGYFQGSPKEQSTFDQLYKKTIDRFEGKQNVRVIKGSSRSAMQALAKLRPEKFDLIYVDAGHQYETVLDDLMDYSELLKDDGFFQMNDCCHSPDGLKLNLGVLEATIKFCKIKDFVPVLVCNTDWTDVLLVKKNSRMIDVVDQIVMNNALAFVEIPHQLLGALTVRYGKTRNLSFI
jgi:predicted O-methyltransferase YrrM